jgi:transcriptional regulator with XRE-family HTH domain
MENFGTRLKQTMEEKGMSASELSRASGVGKNLISYYIHGRCLAKQDKVYLLAKALGVDPGWLMTGVEQIKDEQIRVVDSKVFTKVLNAMTPSEFEQFSDLLNKVEQRIKEKGEL